MRANSERRAAFTANRFVCPGEELVDAVLRATFLTGLDCHLASELPLPGNHNHSSMPLITARRDDTHSLQHARQCHSCLPSACFRGRMPSPLHFGHLGVAASQVTPKMYSKLKIKFAIGRSDLGSGRQTAQMPPEMLQHSAPRVRGSRRVINLRTRVIEERMISLVTHRLN